jgi:uncharacterized RDD family membrane protein YckC
MRKAPLAARYLAFLIDIVFLLFVVALFCGAALAGYLAGMGRPAASGFFGAARSFVLILVCFKAFLCLFYFTYLNAHGEGTLGKGLFGLKVVRRRDGEYIGFARSLARSVCYLFSAFPFCAGFLLPFVLKGRALHDILTGTEVLKEG